MFSNLINKFTMATKKVIPVKTKERYNVHFFLNGTEVVKEIPQLEDLPGEKEIRIVHQTQIKGELYGTAGIKIIPFTSFDNAMKIIEAPEGNYKKK